MYVESSDDDVDFWLKINRNSGRNQAFNRTLRLVVTAFKKRCGSKDHYWRRCKNTNYCVRKEFFCDNKPNCAWRDGIFPYDEEECEEYGRKGGRSPLHNLPVIIIITIVVSVCIVLLFCVIKRVITACQIFRQSSNTANDNSQNFTLDPISGKKRNLP